jgi:protein translocase SecG subunit
MSWILWTILAASAPTIQDDGHNHGGSTMTAKPEEAKPDPAKAREEAQSRKKTLGVFVTICTVLFVIFTILLVFMVVITPSNEGGMAAAFGGMGSDTFFGTKAHAHINKFTLVLAVGFLALALGITALNAQIVKKPKPAAETQR